MKVYIVAIMNADNEPTKTLWIGTNLETALSKVDEYSLKYSDVNLFADVA